MLAATAQGLCKGAAARSSRPDRNCDGESLIHFMLLFKVIILMEIDRLKLNVFVSRKTCVLERKILFDGL